MKIKIKKIIKELFGTEHNIILKFSLSCLFTGILFSMLALYFQNEFQQYLTFTFISGILIAIWFVCLETKDSGWEVINEIVRLIVLFTVLFFSLNFCLNQSIEYNGFKLIFYTTLSCIGILFSSFYLISKFIDILKSIKRIIKYFKNKLLGSEKTMASKVKMLIENITAFLVAIAGLAVAIKALVEPLFNLIK